MQHGKHTDTVYNRTFRWKAGGRPARRGQARSEEGRRMRGWKGGGMGGWGKEGEQEEGWRAGGQIEDGGRVQGDGGGGRLQGEGREGGREQGEGVEAMMLGRQRAPVEEGRVEGGRVDEGNERGTDGTMHGRRYGGSEWRRD